MADGTALVDPVIRTAAISHKPLAMTPVSIQSPFLYTDRDISFYRPPDAFRRQRKIEMHDADRIQRVEHRVGDRGRRSDGTGFADALDAERIDRRRRHRATERELR